MVQATHNKTDYLKLNATVNLYDKDGKLQLDNEKEAVRQYFLNHINPYTIFFHDLEEKLEFLIDEQYYEVDVIDNFLIEEVKELFKYAYSYKFRFATLAGAIKFYNQYALKTYDGERYLERYEDRVAICAIKMSDGDYDTAIKLIDEMMTGRYQPATPTYLNLGKQNRGDYSSCYLITVEDSLNSIFRAVNSSAQLSKRGGGVGINLSSLRGESDPIKGYEGMSSGVIPVMKILEDTFSYANQLGARQGSGVVYLHANHIDILDFLDTKKENADEKRRIKSLSLGVIVPDIVFELAKNNEQMYMFSPYDSSKYYGVPFAEIDITKHYREMVDNPDIRKEKISARTFLAKIASLQMESGYPYLMFIDNANKQNVIDGHIEMSNLCVTGDTMLLTEAGYRRVDELYNSAESLTVVTDDRTESFDFDCFGVTEKDALPIHMTDDDADIYEIETVEGYCIKATEWHKFYRSVNGNVEKVALNELAEGDALLIQSESYDNAGEDFSELAYLVGIWQADGTSSEHSVMFDLHVDKQEFANDIKNAVYHCIDNYHIGDIPYQASVRPEFSHKTSNLNDSMRMSSSIMKNIFDHYGVTKDNIPKFIWEADSKTKWAYISGLYQMNGSMNNKSGSIEMVSVSKSRLIEQQRLLLQLGVFSRIYDSQEEGYRILPDGHGGKKNWCNASYKLFIQDRVSRDRLVNNATLRNVDVDKHNKLVAELKPVSKHKYTARVKSIKYVGSEPVYDTTEFSRNSLIFNGIVTGNCVEIIQVQSATTYSDDQTVDELGKDIICNLGSLNVANMIDSPDFGGSIDTAMRSLSWVSDNVDISTVPSIQHGNETMHAVGLGAMNLHGAFVKYGMDYGSEESVSFTKLFFAAVNYYSLLSSMNQARERNETFENFEKSGYADGTYFDKFIEYSRDYFGGESNDKNRKIFESIMPTTDDWIKLRDDVAKYGLYNAYRLAIPPTGSISYVNHSVPSILPCTGAIEIRKEGKSGRLYYPMPNLSDDNIHLYKDAYDIGWKKLIDVCAAAQFSVDQGISMTVFFDETVSTRELNKAQIYAWKNGIKTIYYTRLKSDNIDGTDKAQECVSCAV